VRGISRTLRTPPSSTPGCSTSSQSNNGERGDLATTPYIRSLDALSMNPEGRRAILTLPAAYALWFFTFQVPVLDFWIRITISASILLAIAVVVGGKGISFRPTP